MKPPAGLLILAAIIAGCAAPTPPPTATSTPPPTLTPTPKPPFEIIVEGCGYGDFGFVTMAGTVTNNTAKPVVFIQAAIALIKNDQVVRTDEIYIADATGDNAGILHGLDYKSVTGGLAPAETIFWTVAYPLEKLTQPFECEASVTSAR